MRDMHTRFLDEEGSYGSLGSSNKPQQWSVASAPYLEFPVGGAVTGLLISHREPPCLRHRDDSGSV